MRYILTNNPKVVQNLENRMNIKYRQISLFEIINLARDAVHSGHKLLTHPLSSSVKPNETPYKSIILEEGTKMDFDSLKIMEESIQTVSKFLNDFDTPYWTDKVLGDFQTIDLSIIENALDGILF